MDYTLIGLITGLGAAIISAWYQFYAQKKLLNTILEMQYNSILYTRNLADFNLTAQPAANPMHPNHLIYDERTNVIGRRINKLMEYYRIELPELETGRK